MASGQVLLPGRDPLPDRLRYRDRAMGLLVGVDPDDFTSDKRLMTVLQENRKLEGEARVADPRHARTDVQFPVEPDRRLVFDDRFDDVEILARLLGIGILIIAERAKIFGDSGVEIGQVVRVEDDALAVDLGIAHPEWMEEPEWLA